MNVQDLRTLFAYNRWANRRLLEASARLSPADLTRDLHASFGSVRGTLFHIFGGERLWLRFFQEGSIVPDPNPKDFPDVASIEASWAKLEEEQRAFASGLTDELLTTPRKVRNREYALGELMQHALNHSTYHRGQVALLLRQLGHVPPATDFRLFLDDAR